MAKKNSATVKSATKALVKTVKSIKPSSLPVLALIAHDGKKAQMVGFVKDHLDLLLRYNLIATATTGTLVSEAGLKVKCMLSGPIGGDAQIAAAVAMGQCQGVIFLRDPLGHHPHDPDISSLLRICDVHNVPLATNLASAQLLIRGLTKL
ncbi:MAG: methylglyoxal synthase [Proteobacteria bacterium]|nr:MAG: methylglyoxal synthase [Pseudomonadota bacterium]